MNKINYQKVLDKELERLAQEEKVPRLLLHSCCAPCSSYVLEYLSQYFEVTIFYYNPNIYPPEEYVSRTAEQERLIRELPAKHPILFLNGPYEPDRFYDTARGLEKVPEGGERCFCCYRLRLEETAQMARAGGYDYFTTTLSISPLKNAEKLNEIGEKLGEEYQVKYLFSDFKKRGGYKRSTELSAQYGLYRQDYCGCVYSLQERRRQQAEMQQERIRQEGMQAAGGNS